MEILTQEGYSFLSRWAHFLAGITWIGLLYYFNFVQVPAFAEMTPEGRSEAMRRVTWRALWWFRWGAMFTVLTGILILAFNEQITRDYFSTVQGTAIAGGGILGIIMFSNVWLVIWPAQQIAIGSANTVADGGEADPGAPAAARRAALASRTNTLFSIPMLLFMGGTSHLFGSSHFAGSLANDSLAAWWVIFVVIVGAIELNALGWPFGHAPHWSKAPYDTIRGVLISGFVLTVVFYVVFEMLFQA
ncbi:MAG: antitermination protein NusG [Chloroflexi bacterium]|nr:antitermination protein NusG [Chloroflexota bacterium]